MKRRLIAAMMLVGSISGCISTGDPEMSGPRPNYGRSFGPPAVPGVMGPYGENISMAAPYNMAPPGSKWAAMNMIGNSMPMSMVHMHPTGMLTPPGVMGMPGTMPGLPGVPSPGAMPPMGGNPLQKMSMTGMADGGVVNANIPPGQRGPGGVAPTQFASSPSGPLFPAQRTQIFFTKPAGMKVFWMSQGANGKVDYSPTPLETPGRYNFAQAAIYRLKLEKIPGRPGVALFPTLEVVPTSPKTNEFLAHMPVPVEFSEDDFKQVFDGNYIVKVIYLPDPAFQDAGGAGPNEIVSTRLEPGQDPIQEALRRGSILLVLRIGSIDQGLEHSPPMSAPAPGGAPPGTRPVNQGAPPLFQVPFPTLPITPGGAPNPLPLNLPKLPDPPKANPTAAPNLIEKKEDKPVAPPLVLPLPSNGKIEDGVKPILPDLPLPPVVKPVVPPVVNPAEKNDKGSSVLPKEMPVVPASNSKDATPPLPPVTLPGLPSVDRSDFPTLPPPPSGGKK